MDKFEAELRGLINKYSLENGSNTPDFILAVYLSKCLEAYNATIDARDKWYKFDPDAKFNLNITSDGGSL